ncbi:hypothetical protein GLOTRDRAFT_129373 [Gloeophyllum trabeum ATCC 11539]|uniref:Uncharacterized protein n=1 Tax=Gloeophyllum trabeum (strain ATCC 11539 / FP-39264 / Madison 617) TaxID=670483 RepID=S7Q4Y1_GLOTA|nr:uncharacterized protein GLOTRDRAFT_129373 [Gloeophyllum trabeum ATCC 11539]EPQ55081.1 hypothetical protein GLOTRDRAFT_129373 [Gloeophyllum trabeum ATCC 11539]
MSSAIAFIFGEQTRINPVQLGSYATQHVIDQFTSVGATVAHGLTANQDTTPTNTNVMSLVDDTCRVPHPRYVRGRAAARASQTFGRFTPNLPPRLRKARPGRRERALLRLQRQAGISHDPTSRQQGPGVVATPGDSTINAPTEASNVVPPQAEHRIPQGPATPDDLPPRRRAKPGRRERALRRLQRQGGLLQDHATSALGPTQGPDPTLPPTPTTPVNASSPGGERAVVGTDNAQFLLEERPDCANALPEVAHIENAAASQHDQPSSSPPPYDPIVLGLEAARFILEQHGSSQYPAVAMTHYHPQYPVAVEQQQLVDGAIERQHAASGEGRSMAVRFEYAEGGSFSRMAVLTDWSPHYWQPRPFMSSLPPNAVSREAVAIPIRVLQNTRYGTGEPEAPYAYSSPWTVPTGRQAPETMVPAPYVAPASTALPQGGFPPERAETPDAPDLTQFPAVPEPSSLALTQALYPFVDCPGPCPADCPRRLMSARAYSRRRYRRHGMSRLPCPMRFDPFDEYLDSEGGAPQCCHAADEVEPASPTSPVSPATATSTSVPTPWTASFNADLSPCSSRKGLAQSGEEILYTTCSGIPVRRERKRVGLVEGEHQSTPWWYLDQREAHRYLELLEYLEHRAVLRVKAKLDNFEESDRPPLMPLWIHFPQLLPPVFDAPPENMLQLQLSGN